MTVVLSRLWRQLICATCGRVVSETIPAYTDRDGSLPSIDYLDRCALCVSLTKPAKA